MTLLDTGLLVSDVSSLPGLLEDLSAFGETSEEKVEVRTTDIM